MQFPISQYKVSDLNLLARNINKWAVGKGFWDFKTYDLAPIDLTHPLVKTTKVMLVVTELAELVEGVRKPAVQASIEGFTNEEEEIADAIIRLLDYAGQYRLRIAEVIEAKMEHNEGRPYRHGKGF